MITVKIVLIIHQASSIEIGFLLFEDKGAFKLDPFSFISSIRYIFFLFLTSVMAINVKKPAPTHRNHPYPCLHAPDDSRCLPTSFCHLVMAFWHSHLCTLRPVPHGNGSGSNAARPEAQSPQGGPNYKEQFLLK